VSVSAGQFLTFFGRTSPLGPRAGMLITAAIVLVLWNVVDLSAIAWVGTACPLLIFLLVGVSAYRLRSETSDYRRERLGRAAERVRPEQPAEASPVPSS
jgi:hypothetical protein